MAKKLLFLIALCYPLILSAQQPLNFIISDSLTHEPLPGATVLLEGTANGASADINGKAIVTITGTGIKKFIIRFVGYEERKISINLSEKDTIRILMTPVAGELEEVTVVSGRNNSRIEALPTRIEVLGKDDLNEENSVKPGNIMSLLGDIAGIQIQQISATSGNSFARIQGLNGRYTQILRDGLPLFGGLSGSFSIMQIPPLDLRQIEIIKGSASTLYGADAIGGIINVISREPSEKQELTFTLNQSTLAETDLNGYFAKRIKKTGITLFASQTYQKQQDINKDSLTDVPFVLTTVIHPRLIFYFSKGSVFTINYTATIDSRKGGETDYFKDNASDTLYHVKNHILRHNGDISWKYRITASTDMNMKFSGSYFDQHLDTKYYPFNARQYIWYSELSFLTKRKKTDWVEGMNFNGDNFDNQTPELIGIFDYGYQTIGGFLQNTWRPVKNLTVETGLRLDYHTKYGFFPLPRLSLMYNFTEHLSARATAGLGYKVPVVIGYVDQETDLKKVAAGISLKPERSQGINADINFQKTFFRKLNITINQSFFFTNLSDPVDSIVSGNEITLQNEAKSLRTKGLQTYTRILYADWELYLGYVLTDISKLYDPVHKELIATPRHNFSTALFFEPGEHWRTGIEGSLIAGQVDENYQSVRNYFLLAAMVQFRAGQFTFVLNGENLFDIRQTRYEKIYTGTVSNPVFHQLWAPVDGRVINLSVRCSL